MTQPTQTNPGTGILVLNIDYNYYDVLKTSTSSYNGNNYVEGGDPLFVDATNNLRELPPYK